MQNFDPNLINAELIVTAMIEVDGKIVRVIDMDEQNIFVQGDDLVTKKISDDDWNPLDLDEDWLTKIKALMGMEIRNVRTGKYWSIKIIGKHFFLATDSDPSLGENPCIPINFIHDLQRWYYILTGTYLKFDFL